MRVTDRFSAIEIGQFKKVIANRVDVDENGCHNWRGMFDRGAFPIITLTPKFGRKSVMVKRFLYELANPDFDPMLNSTKIKCACGNNMCVNPEHLTSTFKQRRKTVLYNTIKKLREDNPDITVKQIANIVGLTVQAIYYYLRDIDNER